MLAEIAETFAKIGATNPKSVSTARSRDLPRYYKARGGAGPQCHVVIRTRSYSLPQRQPNNQTNLYRNRYPTLEPDELMKPIDAGIASVAFGPSPGLKARLKEGAEPALFRGPLYHSPVRRQWMTPGRRLPSSNVSSFSLLKGAGVEFSLVASLYAIGVLVGRRIRLTDLVGGVPRPG